MISYSTHLKVTIQSSSTKPNKDNKFYYLLLAYYFFNLTDSCVRISHNAGAWRLFRQIVIKYSNIYFNFKSSSFLGEYPLNTLELWRSAAGCEFMIGVR
jgi:hypothetical protein